VQLRFGYKTDTFARKVTKQDDPFVKGYQMMPLLERIPIKMIPLQERILDKTTCLQEEIPGT
jgi:hypothetical protein